MRRDENRREYLSVSCKLGQEIHAGEIIFHLPKVSV